MDIYGRKRRIGYRLIGEARWNEIDRLIVEDKVDSDHYPVVV